MFLVKASIKRPIAMMTLLIGLGVFGVLAFRKAGVDLVPSVDSPYITVTVIYPEAQPAVEAPRTVWYTEIPLNDDASQHITMGSEFCGTFSEKQAGPHRSEEGQKDMSKDQAPPFPLLWKRPVHYVIMN